MELRHLRYFIAAAEQLHFTRAADSLHISQPTLSIHIQQLEDELRADLFARVGRNVRLTEAGEILLKRARQSVREIELAGQEIDAITNLMGGELTISSLPAYASTKLPAWLTAFNAEHPNVRIRVRTGSSEDIEKELLDGEIDLALSVLPSGHSEIHASELFKDELVLVFADSHPFAAKEKIEIEDLDRLPMALYSPRQAVMRLLDPYFRERNLTLNVVMEFDHGHSLQGMARLGQLVTMLPKSTIDDDHGLQFRSLPEGGQFLSFAALWTGLSPASRAFLELALVSANPLE